MGHLACSLMCSFKALGRQWLLWGILRILWCKLQLRDSLPTAVINPAKPPAQSQVAAEAEQSLASVAHPLESARSRVELSGEKEYVTWPHTSFLVPTRNEW